MGQPQRLTRRAAITGAAGAGMGVLVAPALAASGSAAARAPGGAPVAVRALGTLAAGATVRIRTERPFCLAALRWAAPAHAHVAIRTLRADGRPGPWAQAAGGAHEGDGVRPLARFGEGVWTGPSRVLELRSRETVHGAALLLVAADAVLAPGADALAPGGLPLAGPSLAAGPGQPPIIARRVWAGEDHPPVGGPFYGTIELGIVHHTENPNGYAAGEVPAMLRAIYEFHVHGRGWFDIGYNFVIDRFGRIWEARQGGVDLPVIGAQAGDWNQLSFGISMLGTFADIVPSPAALDALGRLLAWKLALHGLPAVGDISETVGPDGVDWTQFRVGEHVHFPRVAGHRDVDSTECPGDALYAHLPVLRPRVAALAGAPATLSLSAELVADQAGAETLSLGGRLTLPRGTPAGAPIELEQVVGRMGETRSLLRATTAADGSWSASLPARRGLLLRACHAEAPAVVSPLVALARAPSTIDGTPVAGA